jgi:YcxB-like protein
MGGSEELGYNKIIPSWSLMMSQSLTLKYTPTQLDYAKVLRLFFLQRTGTRISLAILIIAFGLIIFTILSKETPVSAFELIWLLLPPLFVIFVFFIQPSRVAKQAASNEQLIAEATWEVSDQGVQISSSFSSTYLDWEALHKLVTTREYYLLLLKSNKNAFRFLPVRAFATEQEKAQFLELMRNHLSRA